MAKPHLHIEDLHVIVEGKTIVQGVNLDLMGGEVHAIIGPSGTGKSALAMALMGHPRYEARAVSLTLDGQDLLPMKVDERARAGLFLAMQHPPQMQGVTNSNYIRTAVNARRGTSKEVPVLKFHRQLQEQMEALALDPLYAERGINEGFTLGEKKRNEILQMKMLNPRIAILDEIDSGLQEDEYQVVVKAIGEMKSPELGLLLLVSDPRLLDDIEPDVLHEWRGVEDEH